MFDVTAGSSHVQAGRGDPKADWRGLLDLQMDKLGSPVRSIEVGEWRRQVDGRNHARSAHHFGPWLLSGFGSKAAERGITNRA